MPKMTREQHEEMVLDFLTEKLRTRLPHIAQTVIIEVDSDANYFFAARQRNASQVSLTFSPFILRRRDVLAIVEEAARAAYQIHHGLTQATIVREARFA